MTCNSFDKFHIILQLQIEKEETVLRVEMYAHAMMTDTINLRAVTSLASDEISCHMDRIIIIKFRNNKSCEQTTELMKFTLDLLSTFRWCGCE